MLPGTRGTDRHLNLSDRSVQIGRFWNMTINGETNKRIRVALVDDQRLLTSGLASILNIQPNVEVVGQAHTGEEAVEMCMNTRPDVVLMDISMPGMGGVAATREIKTLLPNTRILILTVHTDDAHALRGLKAGAQGYILKDCTPEDLLRAIRAVYNGDTIIARDIAINMLDTSESGRSHADIAPHLTERELEVIKALAEGKSNRKIAQSLGISEKTVRNHTSNIYKKLHIFDRTQAVIYAIREGLVDLEELK
jgi:DNA-binding NarL/FixJ family response regulator